MTPHEQAAALRQEAQQLRAQGRHEEALQVYERLSACLQPLNDPALEATLLLGKIDSLGVLGREREGIALGRELADTLRAADKLVDAARAQMNLVNLLYRQDRHEEALAAFEEVAQVFAGANHPLLLAQARANAANCLSSLGRLGEAQDALQQAQDDFTAQGLLGLAAMAEANHGYLRFLGGSYGPALHDLSHARATFLAETEHSLEAAKCTADRADIYHALQLLPEALRDYSEALPTLEAIPLPYEAARARLGRASVLAAQGRLTEASADLDAAEAAFRTQKNAFFRGRVALLRAQLTGDPTEAHRATRLFRQSGQAGWAAEARLLTAATSTRKLHAIRRTAQAWSRGWLECRAWQALGALYAQQGKPAAAIHARRQAVATLESVRTQLAAPEELHVSYLTDKAELYTDLIDALLTRGRPRDHAEALQILEHSRSRLLLERLTQAAPAQLPHSVALTQLRQALSEAYYRLNGAPDDTRRFGGVPTPESLRQLEERYHAALHEEEHYHSAILPALQPEVALEQLPLRPEEALIAYYSTEEALHAFVLRTGQPLTYVPALCTTRALGLLLRRLRFHLQRPSAAGEAALTTILHELYALLVAPLTPHLGAAQHLIVVPHGAVQGVPFAALHDGAQPLLYRFTFQFTPGITLWRTHTEQPTPTGQGALVIGLAAPEIPAAVEEAQQVTRSLGADRLLIGEAATREAFFRDAPTRQTLHLATHALFRADNPLFSSLQLADGWLLAHDLYGLALSAQLVTLSACQTGLATVLAGGEAFGLVRAFLAAGARTVVASLWNAEDTATRLLMEKFYEHLSLSPSVPAALQAAQHQVRSHYPHPYYWAAFQAFGA